MRELNHSLRISERIGFESELRQGGLVGRRLLLDGSKLSLGIPAVVDQALLGHPRLVLRSIAPMFGIQPSLGETGALWRTAPAG